MIRRPPRSTLSSSSAASDVYKRQGSTRRCGPGDFTTAPATTWPDWRHASTQSCAVGCSITVRSTVRRSTRSCNASTPTWCGGSARSTSGCGRRRRPSGVGGGSSSEPRACSRTGNGFLPSRLSGDQDDKSPVTGDCYAGICGSPGLKCPGPPDRPRRRAQDAIAEMHFLSSDPRKYHWVFEADIEACFDQLSHSALLRRVRQRIADKRVLALIKAFLRAGIMSEAGQTASSSPTSPPATATTSAWKRGSVTAPASRSAFVRPSTAVASITYPPPTLA